MSHYIKHKSGPSKVVYQVIGIHKCLSPLCTSIYLESCRCKTLEMCNIKAIHDIKGSYRYNELNCIYKTKDWKIATKLDIFNYLIS